MRLGFVGAGAIAEHMIAGLIRHGGFDDNIVVSPRNAERAKRLADEFAAVNVGTSNQDVVDQSDIIVIGVLPNQARQVIDELQFVAGQTVISLVAMLSIAELQQLAAPAKHVHRLIPIPPIEFGVGPIPICPPANDEIHQLLSSVGTVVSCDDEDHFSRFSTASATMAVFFELVSTHAGWLESEGVPAQPAHAYSTSIFHALSTMASNTSPAALQSLSEECLTAGGLNEQVLHECRDADWFETFRVRLERIQQRLDSA